MPYIIAIDVIFILGSDDHRRGSNAVQAFPELADPSVRSTVLPPFTHLIELIPAL